MMLQIGAENLDSGWVQHRFCSLNHCQTIPVHACLNEILNIVSRKIHMVFWSIWTLIVVVMVKYFMEGGTIMQSYLIVLGWQ